MTSMLTEIARGPGSPTAKVETLIEAACAFDASGFDMLTRIEADLVAAVERGDRETVELVSAERRAHRPTREVMLAWAEKAIRAHQTQRRGG